MTLNEFVQILKERGCKPKQLQNGQWLALCPAHDDHEPSLSITEGEKGILLNCFAGCSTRDICSALQISERDLFTDSKQLSTPRGCTITDLAQGCQVLRKTLIDLGCCEVQYDGAPAVAFPFQTSDGRVFYHYRIAVDGKDKWRLQAGAPAKQLVFGLEHALQRVQQTNILIITESPLDSSVLFACGFASASVIGKANAYALAEFRDCIPTDCQIFVWVEPQADDFAQGVADALQQPIFAFHSPNSQAKDAYRLLKTNGWDIMKTRDQIVCAMQATVEVCPSPKTLAEILDSIVRFVRKYVLLLPEQADAIALWVAHTYAIDATDTTPYLRINSATKRCGKTRLAEVISCLAYEPRLTTCLSVASLFRLIHAYDGKLTLIVDEVAGTFAGREKSAELSALLNAGWRRGLTVPRVEKTKNNNFVVREYSTFAPKVLVGIGQLHDTVEDRSIRILLQRKRPDEEISDFFLSDAFREAEPIRRALEQWASQPEVIETLRRARPEMPRSVSDRAREGWRILIAIADMAGSAWGEKARKALLELERNREVEDAATNIRLLAALREVFNARETDRLSVQEIAEGFQDLEDPPVPEDFWKWTAVGEWRRVGVWLARTLRPFGVKPTHFRVGSETKRGYQRSDLNPIFERYLGTQDVGGDNDGCAAVPFVPFEETQTAQENPSKIRLVPSVPFVPLHVKNNDTQLDYTNDDKNREYGNSSPLAEASNVVSQTAQTAQTAQPNKTRDFSVPFENSETTQTAQPNSPTNLSQQEEVGQLEWFKCPNCGLRRLMSPDSWLLAGRCPECGADLLPDQPEPPSGGSPSRQVPTDDASEPTNEATNGDGFVNTLEFLEREIGFADPTDLATDQPPPTDLKADQVPDSDQPPEPDQPPRKTKLPPSSCRELANDLLHILREFQRSSKKHQRCLTDPCPICREKVRQICYLERANSRNGLLALWQRAQTWQQAQGGGAA